MILHIDFNSYFASVEQQANPRLRGKPIGVTGGDRMTRTVIGAASVEAKEYGVKTGMTIPDALKLCPNIILVKGDCDKYFECTKRFLNILKDFSPFVEVFSIDEVFLEMSQSNKSSSNLIGGSDQIPDQAGNDIVEIAIDIKNQIRAKVGEWIKCSIGVSYNKVIAKLAGSLFKPNGLVVITDTEAAIKVLDQVGLDEICGIGPRIKKRLNNMGVFDFKDLRKVPLENLLASFKSYGKFLYDISRGINDSPVVPFYEKEEVKSVGHRHTLYKDTSSPEEIKQTLLKLAELVARRLRAKNLVGKTVSLWFRYSLNLASHMSSGNSKFVGDGMQRTVPYTGDGLEIFRAGWKIFLSLWDGKAIRMIGTSVSNLKPINPENLSFLPEIKRKEVITKALDKINDKYGEFTLQRGILLKSAKVTRMANPFLADRRFKI